MELKFTDYKTKPTGMGTNVNVLFNPPEVKVLSRFFGCIATKAMQGRIKIPEADASAILNEVQTFVVRPGELVRSMGYNLPALEEMAAFVTRYALMGRNEAGDPNSGAIPQAIADPAQQIFVEALSKTYMHRASLGGAELSVADFLPSAPEITE